MRLCGRIPLSWVWVWPFSSIEVTLVLEPASFALSLAPFAVWRRALFHSLAVRLNSSLEIWSGGLSKFQARHRALGPKGWAVRHSVVVGRAERHFSLEVRGQLRLLPELPALARLLAFRSGSLN